MFSVKFDLELMTASAFVFLLAGTDTTAGTMGFILYELAANQDLQERLLQEIIEVLKNHDGVPTYEAVKGMKYLNQVISGEYFKCLDYSSDVLLESK